MLSSLEASKIYICNEWRCSAVGNWAQLHRNTTPVQIRLKRPSAGCHTHWQKILRLHEFWDTYMPYCKEDQGHAQDQRKHVAEGSKGKHNWLGKRWIISQRSTIPLKNIYNKKRERKTRGGGAGRKFSRCHEEPTHCRHHDCAHYNNKLLQEKPFPKDEHDPPTPPRTPAAVAMRVFKVQAGLKSAHLAWPPVSVHTDVEDWQT